MLRKKFINNQYSRRAFCLGAGKMLMLSAIGARIYYLQVVESDKYQILAEGNRIRLYPFLPKRGRVLDRNNQVLAHGISSYSVLYQAVGDESSQDVISKLARILELDFNGEQKILERIAKNKSRQPIIISDFLKWEEVAEIEVNALDLAGVEVLSSYTRNYPYSTDCAHLVGYIGKPSSDELGDGVLSKHPDFRIGKTGVEKIMDESLRGVAGIRHVEVDHRGRFVRELEEEAPIHGNDVNLTINIELQKFVKSILAKKGGLQTEGASAVVMDIENGDVLAMASVPSYDPNAFVRGIKQDYWDKLINNPDAPLTNKSVHLQYPPGSTFKLITALAALEAGVITPETTKYCGGYHKFGGRKFHCWNIHGHGEIDMTKALAVSCNVYFFKIAAQVGVNKMADMARRFGLGSPTGIEISGEKAGLVPDKQWKRDTLNQPWYGGESLNNAIGQGFLSATTLQLATMVSRVASMGKAVKPRLLLNQGQFNYDGDYNSDYEVVAMDNGEKLVLPKSEIVFPDINVNKQHLASVMQAMGDVTNKEYGGSYRARIKDPKMAMAGKTGTSQLLSNRRWKHVPAERSSRYHALFVGYAPISKPKYAVSIIVEHGGYGSVVAAPLGRDILTKVQELYHAK